MTEKGVTSPPNRLAGEGGFKGKTLFITGGSGFMGKVLIEKILRTLPVIEKIYVLVRAKKGKNPQERLNEIFASPLYDLVKSIGGEEVLQKVVAVEGDVTEDAYGLSVNNRRMLIEEVNIIYHMAATVRFDEPLKKAVLINTKGTKTILELAAECKNLQALCHVSTAYCHLEEKLLHEKAYPPPADPHSIIKLVDSMREEFVEVISKTILGQSPNTYSFSKALGEGLVNEQLEKLPVIIMRPSVVVPIWKQPLPGWTDNINGPTGMLIAAGKGVLRTMYCDSEKYADFIPVDIAANALLLATFYYMTSKKRQIFNLTSSFEFKVTWREIIEIGRTIVETRMPLNWVVWYPGGSMYSSRLLHNISRVLFHYIPATFVDALLTLTGNNPILWRVHRRISKGMEIFEYYTHRQWDFKNEAAADVREWMNETERHLFQIDGNDFNLEEYFYNSTHAARLYILKEGDETIPRARLHMKVMWVIDVIFKTLFLIGVLYMLFKFLL